ncbi:MAG: lysophospholipid acyltransferase family protein [Saprospiraceae bacterium]
MFSSIRPWFKFTVVVLILAFYLSRLLIISILTGKNEHRSFRFRKKFCLTSIRILGIDYQKQGSPYPGVCLYVSNHRSMLDPLIELSWMDTYILSKAEVGDYPLLGRGAKETGVVFVDRENHKSRKNALNAIESLLKSNCSVMIYPEGTTHSEDLTGEFRKGAIELAFDLGVPIVPVMIEYPDSSYYWSHEKLMDYFVRIFRPARKIIVKGKIGEPIDSDHRKHIVSMTQNEINKMIIEVRKDFRINIPSGQ